MFEHELLARHLEPIPDRFLEIAIPLELFPRLDDGKVFPSAAIPLQVGLGGFKADCRVVGKRLGPCVREFPGAVAAASGAQLK